MALDFDPSADKCFVESDFPMRSITPEQRAARIRYCNLMSEIRLRHQTIIKALDGTYKIPDLPTFEFCHLQLRMICETIALACIVVHGDIPATRSARMRKATKADWIINALEYIHPNFYPQPGVQVVHVDGHHEFIATDSGFLTKPKLLDLFHHCGALLHRGTIQTIQKIEDELDFNSIPLQLTLIAALLSSHRISLFGAEDEIWVTMKSDQTEKVRAILVGPNRLT